MSKLTIGSIACIIIGGLLLLLPSGGDVVPVDPVDGDELTQLIATADAAYWDGYADLCIEMAAEYPEGWPPEANEEWNTALQIHRGETHGRINTLRAEATETGNLAEFGRKIKEHQ